MLYTMDNIICVYTIGVVLNNLKCYILHIILYLYILLIMFYTIEMSYTIANTILLYILYW